MSFRASCTILILLAGIFVAPFSGLAQEVVAGSSAIVDSPISFTVNPKYPGPNQSVTVSITSYLVDLKTAEIKWTQGGKTVYSGIGADTYNTATKAAGASVTLSVSVKPVTGDIVTASTTIVPMQMDVLWQAIDSTVPPLYRGKALPTAEGTIRFWAFPDLRASGKVVAPSTAMYTWKFGYVLDQKASGYGKNTFTVQGSSLDKGIHVDVLAASKDATAQTGSAVDVVPSIPKIVWYEAGPSYGPRFSKALGDAYDIDGSDISLLAEPYFFSPGTPLSPNLLYTWRLNGKELATPSLPNTLFLHRDDSEPGTANISLTVSNVKTFLQEVSSKMTLRLN